MEKNQPFVNMKMVFMFKMEGGVKNPSSLQLKTDFLFARISR